MVSTTATVLRHNRATPSVGQPAEPRRIEIPLRRAVSCRVVSGDIVVLSAGDMVPPTAAFLARDLFVAQAAMTGEQTVTAFQAGINCVRWLLVRFGMVMAPVILLVNGFTKGSWAKAALFARPNF